MIIQMLIIKNKVKRTLWENMVMTQKPCYVKEGSVVQFGVEIDKEAEFKN